jgi:predicted AlkP superfamily phosphohydrolase/phosphomutase
MRRRTEVALELLANVDWDLAFVVYEYSDTVGHRFGIFTDEWDAVYRAVDAEIAALLGAADEATTVMLVSDHGWARYPRSVNFNAWMRKRGLNEWKTSLPSSGNFIGISAADTPKGAPPGGGREAEKDALARMVRDMNQLTDPKTGTKVVRNVGESHHVFDGPFANMAPGRLLVETDPNYRAALGDGRGPVFRRKAKEHHSDEGIYLLAGPGIQSGPGAPRTVYDVAPTVLRFFGIAPPEDTEGRAMHDFAVPEPLAAAGPSYFRGANVPPDPSAPGVSPELEESLRALGYIE